MFFYKVYKYSNKATFASAFSGLLSLVLFILACFSYSFFENVALKFGGIIVGLLLAVFCFIYLSRMLPDKIAESDFEKKITTNVKFAYRYCKENPGSYEMVSQKNPEFAELYRIDEEGKLYKLD